MLSLSLSLFLSAAVGRREEEKTFGERDFETKKTWRKRRRVFFVALWCVVGKSFLFVRVCVRDEAWRKRWKIIIIIEKKKKKKKKKKKE